LKTYVEDNISLKGNSECWAQFTIYLHYIHKDIGLYVYKAEV